MQLPPLSSMLSTAVIITNTCHYILSNSFTTIEQALELDPQYVKAWAKKGDIEFFMKEYHKALESYQQGLQVEPNNSLCVAGLQKTKLKVRTVPHSYTVL
jgi:tetratricopeptide (TPR) repeat protein